FIQPAAVPLDNARLFSEVKRLATTDGLTGLSNRRHFLLLGHRVFETAKRYGQPLSALMMDVDRFKQVNDRYGHSVGDEVLREIAARTRECLRAADLLGRYGGEEFAMLLPMTQGLAAHNLLAERIRRAGWKAARIELCCPPRRRTLWHVRPGQSIDELRPAAEERRGAAESLGEELGGETRWKTIARGPGGSSFLFPVIEGGRSVGTLET